MVVAIQFCSVMVWACKVQAVPVSGSNSSSGEGSASWFCKYEYQIQFQSGIGRRVPKNGSGRLDGY